MDFTTSFAKAAEDFVEGVQDRLAPEDAPAVTALLVAGQALDAQESPSAPLLAQYGLSHRALLKRLEQRAGGPVDPLEALLDG